MKHNLFIIIFMVVSASLCWIDRIEGAESQAIFRAGAATSVITPPLGGLIIGSFAPHPATHIHDELHARCLVLDDGKTKVAIVVCDLLGVHRSLAVEAKSLIEKELGIPASHISVSATHTHYAVNALYNEIRTYQSDIELTDYQHFVARRIADGVKRADNLLRPAEMAFSTVDIPEHVFNRRWFLKEGTMPENPFGKTDEKVKMNPKPGAPENIKPAGPTDPRVSFLAFREPDGKAIALYSAYSLHYVGGVPRATVSADYYGYYCRDVEKALSQPDQDPPVVALMANGTSGDVNNINFFQPQPSKKPFEHMQFVANDIATKVTTALKSAEWKSDVTLDARYEEIADLKWRTIPQELVDWCKRMESEAAKGEKKSVATLLYAERIQNLAKASPQTKYPVHAVRIGDVCIGMAPCEVFAETGMEFRERSPFKHSFMTELTDGYYGYMPTPRHFELGGYETWPASNYLEPQASVKMLNTVIKLATELKDAQSSK